MKLLRAVWVFATMAVLVGDPTRRVPVASSVSATTPTEQAAVTARMAKLPLRFEANAGQWDDRVRFVARQGGATLSITDEGMTIGLRDVKASPRTPGMSPGEENTAREKALAEAKTAAVSMKLVGASARAPKGEDELITKSNFFLGDDKTKWRTDVPNFGQVRAKDWVPGVDVVWHGGDNGLEYDLEVAAGVDARELALEIEGADRIDVAEDGALEIATSAGTLVQRPPRVVQDGRELPTRYVMRGARRVGFALDGYDDRLALLIDPVLTYSTYLGGAGNDYGWGVAVDTAGNAYVTGTTGGNFPTANAYQGTYGGGAGFAPSDVFVTKLNAAGNALAYSTYLGGAGTDLGYGIAVDTAGNAYVTGKTSGNFPTANAYQGTFGGGAQDVFVTKLNAVGNALVYSTYLGGAGTDLGYGIAIGTAGDACVTGYTSGGFPTASAHQGTFGGAQDVFVTKLNAAGNALAYSTYLGGAGNDFGRGIAVDSAGNAYVTGQTDGSFPTVNAYQGTFGGVQDVFVTKLNAAGNALVYSTYVGGAGTDVGHAVAVDTAGNVYVTGQTSGGFPTANAIQGAFGGGFVTKLNTAGSALVYSTYLGGIGVDQGQGIAVDVVGNAYVTGLTSGGFPTANAYQGTYGGNNDAFVTKLNAAGNALMYSTYLGGTGDDFGAGIAVDTSGSAYATGYTTGSFPTANAYQGTYGGGNDDAFVAKFADPELASGTSCTQPGQCASNLCVDGVCCDTACAGACEACDVSGHVGTCTPTTGPPHGPRSSCQTTSTCTATCDGKNTKACTYGPDACASTCSDGAEDDTLCDTSGACTVKKLRSCKNLICADSTTCKDKCTSNSDCLSGFACAPDGTCEPGGTCIDDHTSKGANSVVQDCAPFKCDKGKCKSSCNSVDDCVVPDVCDPNGKCASLTSSDSAGCSSTAGPARDARWFALFGVFGISFIRARRRRQ